MNNFKKLITIIIRLQALAIILVAIIQWGIIAVSIIIASLSPNRAFNFDAYLISSVMYLIVGSILYARSKSLANYLIAGLPDETESAPQDNTQI